jgi:hypothetical protein
MTTQLAPPTVQAINTPDPCPRVEITVTPAADTVTVTVYRTDPTGTYEVRGGFRHPVAGPEIVVDYEAPFGRPLTYTVTAYDAAGTPGPRSLPSAIVLLPDPLCPWLADVLIPSTALAVAPVDWADQDHSRKNTQLWPSTADAAVVVSNVRPRATSPITIFTYTDGEAGRLLQVLSAAAVILRPPASWTWPGGTYYADAVTETRYAPKRPADQRRIWGFTLVPVLAPPATLSQSPITWARVVALYSTWADLIAAKPTWFEVLRNPDPGSP